MRIEIVDVGPRDGLQNEDRRLSPEVRAELCDKLAAAGLPRVEAASFVNPKRVPQMAGAEEVFAKIVGRPGTIYAGLVLNEKGYERALSAGVDEVRYAFTVTETFARRNQNTTLADATALRGDGGSGVPVARDGLRDGDRHRGAHRDRGVDVGSARQGAAGAGLQGRELCLSLSALQHAA